MDYEETNEVDMPEEVVEEQDESESLESITGIEEPAQEPEQAPQATVMNRAGKMASFQVSGFVACPKL